MAIVGAGMAGLIAARELDRQGIDVLVLESADRVGGRVLAETSALGSRLDLGGQWVGYGHHRLEALAAELGATVFAMRSPRRPTILEGTTTVGTWLTLAFATSRLAELEIRSRLRVPKSWASQTVEAWISSTPGSRTRQLLDALASVTTTADLDRYSMAAFAQMTRYQGGLASMMASKGGAQESLITQGAGTLAERLAADLAPRVLTGHGVLSIQHREDGVTLTTARGGIEAEQAIVTAPPPVAARIDYDPPLSGPISTLGRTTYMGSVYKAIAIFDRPFWRPRTSGEFIVLGDLPFAVFDTTPPDGPGHLCFLVAGRAARQLDHLTNAERRHLLLGRLAPHTGPEVLDPVDWHEKSWHLDEHVGGGYAAIPEPGTTDGFLPMPSQAIGRLHWAGTETAGEHAGYIEGAIESGERVAHEIIEARPKTA
ncbi:FAD-dependent oxidoreductase [Aeromicrobium sp. YIM 150415]|uniref:flavin monoamine oxidase family protein n=1 Tax=Aeromicrobium sp. YIM 150415 TaxID=2803912 RepID=UPI0027DC8C6A|nr:FAD-dependent oxidoreductase [Aeromicrobium sp. YIM 150415]